MYVTKTLDVHQIFRWFDSSDYKYLMLFLPSFNPQDRHIEDYVIENQLSIDRLTGDLIAYISYDKDIDNSKSNNFFFHIDECSLNRNQIKSGIALSEQICDFYSIAQFELPALILISKNRKREYTLYPISTEAEMDTYLLPLKTLNSFIKDVSSFKRRKDAINSFPNQLRQSQDSLAKIEGEIKKYEYAIEVLAKDNNVSERISENYHLLLSECKKKSFKQKEFDDLLLSPIDESVVIAKFLEIGVEEQYVDIIKKLVSDLNIIPNYNKFQSHLGSISKQVENLCAEIQSEMEDLYDARELNVAEIADLQDNCDRSEAMLENVQRKYQVMIETYTNELNRCLFIDNGKELLQEIAKTSSYNVVNILKMVSEKRKRVNLMLEEIKQKIREKSFDVFISCKSEDYDSAQALYHHLEQLGHHPFVANVSLREIGMDNYGPIIRRVIGTCKSMIVYATKLEYLTTPYVFVEWNQFLDELSSGYNKGNIISILPTDVKSSELPDGLRTKQYLTLDNYRSSLSNYL